MLYILENFLKWETDTVVPLATPSQFVLFTGEWVFA
jgi:hypothetical protein